MKVMKLIEDKTICKLLRPSDEASQVSLWLDVLADAKVLRAFLEQRVDLRKNVKEGKTPG